MAGKEKKGNAFTNNPIVKAIGEIDISEATQENIMHAATLRN